MGKILFGTLLILLSIAALVVVILLWIVPEDWHLWELLMLIAAVVFVFASGLFLGGLFIERGIRDRREIEFRDN